MGTVTLRFAEKADAGMMMAIYAPFVLETTATWETAVPPRPEFEARMERCSADGLPWLVAEEGGALLGYAYAARFGRRAGYAWDVEVSVYLSEDAHGRHIGTALYGALLALVSRQGYIIWPFLRGRRLRQSRCRFLQCLRNRLPPCCGGPPCW